MDTGLDAFLKRVGAVRLGKSKRPFLLIPLMDGSIILIVIIRIIWIEVELIPQLEVSYLCHLQVNLLLDQNPLVDIKMRDVVDQREKEGVFVTH